MSRRHVLFAVLPFALACGPDKPAVTITAPPVSSAAAKPDPERSQAPASSSATVKYSGHGSDSVTQEILAQYAAPSLPSDLSRKIQSMLDVRAPSGGVLSPDGKRLFFTWAVTGVPHVWRIDGPQRFPVEMTGGEDATGIAAISPNGKFLVLSRDRKGEEYPGLYLQSTDGGALTPIQHQSKVQTILAFVTDDAKSIYFRANDLKRDSYAIYRYDLAKKTRELVFDQDGLWDVADHRPDGKLLLVKNTGSMWQEYYEYDPASKALAPLFGQSEKEEYQAHYAAAPGEVLVLTRKLGEFRRLYRWKAGHFSPVSPEIAHDIDGFSIDNTRQHLFYEVNDGGFARLFALDAKTYKDRKLPQLPSADHVWAGTSTHDGKWTVLGVGTTKAPQTNYVVEWSTGKVVQWHLPSAPEIDTARFANVTLESYPARDGTKIPMLVRRPDGCEKGADPCPVIVAFHGGPEGQSLPNFSPRAQLFVDSGFVYVEPNVRGSEGYGKTWAHADDGPKRLQIITDIEDASKFVRTSWAKNGKAPKLGIFGGSYGGYSTLIGMTMFAGAYDAGASVVGISSLVTFLENTAPYRRALRVSEYGDLEKDRDALVKLSPITYIDKVRAPLLIVQGATDPRVPVGEAIQFHDALEARKVPNRLILFPDEGHGSQRRENRVLEIGHVLQFFESHLKR